MLSVIPIGGSEAGELAKDERFKKISFTGSSQVGWDLKAADPKKAVTLELGGNAGVIVHSDGDLDKAAQRVAFGGFYQAGQSCISVQRVLVQSEVFDAFKEKVVAEVEKLKTGDPSDPETDVGPLINHDALEKVSSLVDEAVQSGAEILVGGKREDPFYAPTILSRTRNEMKVRQEEIFGPVVTLESYESFEEAIELANETALRVASRCLHSGRDAHPAGSSRHRSGRRHRQRRFCVPSRPDALRRDQGLWQRARGTSVRDGRDD